MVRKSSNIADEPSRGLVELTAKQFKAVMVDGRVKESTVKELMEFSSVNLLNATASTR